MNRSTMKRIAISGSYSTGKTLTTLVTSKILGISPIFGSAMRELLPKYLPNKKLEDCDTNDFIELITRRTLGRVLTTKNTSFISDGCPLQEWAYCFARMEFGINPNESKDKLIEYKEKEPEKWKVFDVAIEAFLTVAKVYVENNYDLLIHLPIEFPLVVDGHRPVNEEFRLRSDDLLIGIYNEISIPVIKISGSLEERAMDIVDYLKVSPKMSIDKAIELSYAEKKVRFDSIEIE